MLPKAVNSVCYRHIVNTAEETIKISDELTRIADQLVEKAGMVVLGTAGYEQSIRRLFDDFAEAAKTGTRALSAGLFWGVYMGQRDPGPLSQEELEKKIKVRIDSGVVSPHIANMIERTTRSTVCSRSFRSGTPAPSYSS